MQKLTIAFLLLLPACFDPPQPLCNFACGPSGACPESYACLADGYCHLHGAAGDCGYSDLGVPALPDLSVSLDLASIDAVTADLEPAPSCTDGIQNGSETAIDCGGGTCPKCALSKACAGFSTGGRDCQSGHCSALDKVCVATDCNDQTMNDAETDVDCGGGTCAACAVGKTCAGFADGARDCMSGVCAAVAKICVAAAGCSDQTMDNLETDVDCGGGGCATCANGKACGGLANGVRDCMSGFCSATGKVCVATACLDQSQDNAETDVDCGGGTCSTCANGKSCLIGADCASGFCSAISKVCVASACLDQTMNNAETDVDCGGGTCPACANGKACGGFADGARDCTSTICSATSKRCVATACADETKDNAETDIDCGGGTCSPCVNGKACLVLADCVSTYCHNLDHLCMASSCPDGVMDGTETDIDCGGGAMGSCPTTTCASNQMCTIGADCTSMTCLGTNLCM